MKTLGNDIYIQRGETWSLDFEVTNRNGDPYMLFKEWKNPYLAITVTAARYEQKGDFRRTWWLDMDNRWVEKEDGTFEIIPMKRFTETNALYTEYHTIAQVVSVYDRVILDKESPFDATNFLFYTDSDSDDTRVYKYVKDYTLEGDRVEDEVWEEYNFRLIKQFATKDWTEQNYLFDIKILAGESVEEYVHAKLVSQEETEIPDLLWTDVDTLTQIKRISDKTTRKWVQEIFDSGQPLMPDFDTKNLVLYPTKLTVSTNIQGGF